MGLFSRKPKHAPAPPPSSPATEHGSPLSPPEARYANANSRRPSAASSLAPRAESPLPAIPMRAPQQHNQQPRASPASHPREHAAADDAYAGGFSQHQQYAQDQQRRRELPREPSDPATYTLPGLGLSPPSTLVPLGLGLKGSTGSSPGSPVDGYGQALGYGFPQQTGADHRSFRGAMSESPTTYAAPSPPFHAPASSSRSASPATVPPSSSSASSATPTSTFFPYSSASSSAAHTPTTTVESSVAQHASYGYAGYDDGDGDDAPLARPPPLSSDASSGPPSPATSIGSSAGGKHAQQQQQPRRRGFLGLFSGANDSAVGLALSSGAGPGTGKGKEKASREDEPFGLAYESYGRSHASPTTTGPPTTTTAPLPPAPTPTPIAIRPAPARRASSSTTATRLAKSPTSPSLSIEAELQAATTAAPGVAQATPRPNPRPSPSQRSSSFFTNALRVSIASSSSKSATSPAPPAPAELARPTSPAESFRVISARRITTPDETLLSISPSAGAPPSAAAGGWLGARPRPGMGERKRSQSYEWTRSAVDPTPTTAAATVSDSPNGGVEELRSPEKDREGALRERRVSVAAFRRRRSSAGFDGAGGGGGAGDVLVIGREKIQLQAKAAVAAQQQQQADGAESAVADDSSDDDDKPLGMLRATCGRSTPTPGAVLPPISPLAPLSASLPRVGSSANLSASLGALPPKPSASGFSVSSRPPHQHQRGYSLALPSPTLSSPSSTVDGDSSASRRPVTPTPTNPNPALSSPSATASVSTAPPPRAFPPRSSSMQNIGSPPAPGSWKRPDERPAAAGEEDDDRPLFPPPQVGSKSMPASPKRQPEAALLSRSPGPAVEPLPVGTRPARPGGPIARPTSRYEMAKAAAAARKVVPVYSSSSDDKNDGSSSDDDAPLRPASRASTALRPRSPATSLAPSRRPAAASSGSAAAVGAGKSPREPLLTLPRELEKPVLDRQRSVRRASVGDADQILSDVASAKARLASVAAAAGTGARHQPSSLRPVGDDGLGGRPPARRRGSESVLSRMEKERLTTHAEDSDTSDGYGQDGDGPSPSTIRALAATPKPSFLKQKAEPAPLEIPPFVQAPVAAPSPSSARQQLDNVGDSDSDDDDDAPLGKLVPVSQSARMAHKALSSASNPTLRIISASPQGTPVAVSKLGRSNLSRPPMPNRSTSTNSLSSLASSSSSSSAVSISVAAKPPAPRSILRRTSFADELSTSAPPSSRMSAYSTSPSAHTHALPAPAPARLGMSHAARSVSTTSIPSPTTSTQFPPRPAFHAQPRSGGSPASSSASGRTTGESSSSFMPVTPRESIDVARPGGGRKASFGKDAQSVVTDEGDESPDEAELERRRNERRRNEAKNAVKLGNYANGSAPHPNRDDEDDDDDHHHHHQEPAPTAFPPFPQQPFPNPFGHPFAAAAGMPPPFPQFSPGGGPMPLSGGYMDPSMFLMQMQLQQAQLAMQMQMAHMAGADPNMHFQAMSMGKAQFQQAMAAQAAQLAGDQWESMSSVGGGGNGAMSEAGFPPSSMGALGMGLPGGFNPAMNRFSSSGSMYGGGGGAGGPGYAASAYGGGGPDMSQWNQPQAHAPYGNHFSSARSDYGGVAAASSRPRRDRFPSQEPSQPPSRDSFYGAESRSSTNLHADGRPAEQDYYQQSRIPQQQQQQQQSSHARSRLSSNPQVPAGRRTSFASSPAAPLVSFSSSPPNASHRPEDRHDRSHHVPPRIRTPSSSHAAKPLVPPSAPFAREARPGSPRSTSPNPPSSWKNGL